jgi:E3 ubiquitin-protein ligase SIAH1
MRATNADAARVFLLVNGSDVPSERSLSVVCVDPRPNGNRSLEYKLHVRGAGSLALSA